ncbi:unnamed protein product, partial [Heterosigma akashiwo]
RQALLIRDARDHLKKRSEIKRILISHFVEEDDTLSLIGEKYGVAVSDIRKQNRRLFPVGEAGKLRPGMQLNFTIITELSPSISATNKAS